MDKQEKIKVAITAGIAAVILLILVLFLALSGKKNNDGEKLEANIAGYSEGDKPDAVQSASLVTTSEDIPEKSDLAVTEDSGSTGSSVLTYSEYKDTAKGHVSGNSFYVTKSATLRDVYRKVEYDAAQQLKELNGYWQEGNTEAVRDLAHLERFEAMSYSLTGTSDFYYYGETDADGLPNGIGTAIYADDQYYYGQWVNGKRSGDGTWFSFYPVYSSYVVKEHMYSGQWSEDKPNGKGQEHYDYNDAYMNSEDVYLQNIIGVFTQGCYNGNMYVITLDKDGNTTEWEGSCNKGTWSAVINASNDTKGRIPVLTNKQNSENHLYMTEEGAKNNCVSGLISGGTVRK